MKKHVIKKALQALANPPTNAIKDLSNATDGEDRADLERLAKALNLKVNKQKTTSATDGDKNKNTAPK